MRIVNDNRIVLRFTTDTQLMRPHWHNMITNAKRANKDFRRIQHLSENNTVAMKIS